MLVGCIYVFENMLRPVEFWLSQSKFLSTQAGGGPFVPSKVEMWQFHSFVFSPNNLPEGVEVCTLLSPLIN